MYRLYSRRILTAVVVQPLNLDFASLIVAEGEILASKQSDRHKLSSLGEIYYNCSLNILAKSEELLDLATRHGDSDADVAIDASFEEFLQSWLQKSVSIDFLGAYMQPRQRQEYTREASDVEVIEIESVEAVAAFAIEDELAQTLEIAHEESIAKWGECLIEVMELWGERKYTFEQLVSLSNLSRGQVFLALFLDEQFRLNQQGVFYGDIVVH